MAAPAFAVAALLVLSGCAYTMGEFSRSASAPVADPAVKEAVLQDEAVPLKPTALVEEEPDPAAASGSAATAAAVAPPVYPNLNVTPPARSSKLLTPEEKAKVIADLEALARKQGAAMSKERASAKTACEGLSAEELRKRLLQGQC